MAKRILLLSDVNSSHTRKLVTGLAGEGFEIGVFSLSKRQQDWFAGSRSITMFDETGFGAEIFHGSSMQKLAYLKQVRALKKTIRAFRPEIVHAHYATSYGMLGWLSGFHPLIISSWGSDVLDFPKSGGVKRSLLKKILASADQLMVTSRTLETAVKEISGRGSLVTPFGVDTKVFAPGPGKPFFPPGTLVFGTVKSLEKVYGAETLIRAYAELRQKLTVPTGLLLVGDGTERENLIRLVEKLGVTAHVTFTGRVDHAEIAAYHNSIDVFMNLSEYESFGVSVLEAMACEKPVIVTDTGGLAEIVEKGVEGYRVPVNDVAAAAAAMFNMVPYEKLRKGMGKHGREKVLSEYQWEKTMRLISGAYHQLVK